MNWVANMFGGNDTNTSFTGELDFVGISEQGFADLKTAFNTYINKMEDIINGFNEKGDIEIALRGDMQTQMVDYIASIKELLVAYVTQMRQNFDDMDAAYEAFKSGDTTIGQNVSSEASDIRSKAGTIRLDQ